MDKIIVKDLEIYAFHGVNPEENKMGQKFMVSLEISLDFRLAGQTDDLNKSISYADICMFVENLFLKENYMLIERCAELTAEAILLEFNLITKIKVLIKKPWAPIGSHLDYAGVEIERGWHKVFLGLGSNMGNTNKNIEKAIEALGRDNISNVVNISKLYKTKPWGNTEQDDFLNCAVEIKTLLTPIELLHFVLDIEKQLKRERLVHWGSRTIDIDILMYDDLITDVEDIIIPHPRITERLFVLAPLNDIAPYVVHPLENKRITDLKSILEKTETL